MTKAIKLEEAERGNWLQNALSAAKRQIEDMKHAEIDVKDAQAKIKSLKAQNANLQKALEAANATVARLNAAAPDRVFNLSDMRE